MQLFSIIVVVYVKLEQSHRSNMLLSEYLEIFPHSYHVRAGAGKEKLRDRDRPQKTCNRQTASKSLSHMLIRNLERCRRVMEGQGLP